MKLQDTQGSGSAILIVDDEPETVKELGIFLENQGFQIFGAQSGEQALELIEHVKPGPELILLDVRMPAGIGGFETCRQLKESEITEDISVIFLSALHETTNKVQGFDVGGVDYITKPFDHHEVLARVNTHIALRKSQQQLQEKNQELEKVNKQLEEEKQRSQTLLDAIPDGVVMHNNGHIREVNQSFEKMFGYQREKICKRQIREFVTELPEGIEPIETTGKKREGSSFPVEIRQRTTCYEGNNVEVVIIRDLSEEKALEIENKALQAKIKKRRSFGYLVGESLPMQRVYELIECMAPAPKDANILITGETGTGKKLVAKTIHQLSKLKNQRFIIVNCGEIQESLVNSELFGHEKGAFTDAISQHIGYFEQADGGTIFLDEVGELKSDVQVKLLRVLEDQVIRRVGGKNAIPVNVRILAATNRNLEAMVAEGSFRQDLFYRLNILRISIPPLRDRQEDIPLLMEHFIQEYCKKNNTSPKKIPQKVMAELQNRDWQGNVRALRNEVIRFMTLDGLLQIDESSCHDIEHEIPQSDCAARYRKLTDIHEEQEKQLFSEVLNRNKGNKSATARELDMARQSLINKLEKHGLL